MFDPTLHRRLDQGAAFGVVVIILQRVFHRFGHNHRSGEMHDRLDPLLGNDAAIKPASSISP
jgi:hypothetical protein